jgi:hypothetical protein
VHAGEKGCGLLRIIPQNRKLMYSALLRLTQIYFKE